jgi:hypothetical protein
MKIKLEHDDDCPKGLNGLRAYSEARDAFASLPPEAHATPQDREANAIAEHELEAKQVCTCGVASLQAFVVGVGGNTVAMIIGQHLAPGKRVKPGSLMESEMIEDPKMLRVPLGDKTIAVVSVSSDPQILVRKVDIHV